MERRGFVRLMGGGVVLAAAPALVACSSALPAEAVAAWQPPPPPAPGGDVRRWLLAHAILAPHSHNLQSWLVDLRQPGEIALYCDRTRLLPETDPFSRQIMMSQGTFLEVLDLAARQLGLRADITLFPQGEFDPRSAPANGLTARIRLVPDAGVRPDPLFGQVLRRHTNRSAYEMKAPDAAALQAIAASAMGLGDTLKLRVGFTGPQDARIAEHRAIAREAWRIELVTPRTVLESYRVLRIGPDEIARHRDGISLNDPMVRALTAVGLFDRSRPPGPDDSATTGQIRDFATKIEATPAFFWMVTDGNDRRTQVQAGRAYVRAQLAATAQGLSMHPLQQALQEYPEQAGPYAAIHRLLGAERPGQTVQMWARLGYAPPVGPAPRRGVGAHLMPA
jgi:hypothetical protein